jgi:hypothetical protein
LKCEAWIDEIQRKIAKGEWPSIALEANKNVDLESTTKVAREEIKISVGQRVY